MRFDDDVDGDGDGDGDKGTRVGYLGQVGLGSCGGNRN